MDVVIFVGRLFYCFVMFIVFRKNEYFNILLGDGVVFIDGEIFWLFFVVI